MSLVDRLTDWAVEHAFENEGMVTDDEIWERAEMELPDASDEELEELVQTVADGLPEALKEANDRAREDWEARHGG